MCAKCGVSMLCALGMCAWCIVMCSVLYAVGKYMVSMVSCVLCMVFVYCMFVVLFGGIRVVSFWNQDLVGNRASL